MKDNKFYIYGNFYRIKEELYNQNLIVVNDGTVYNPKEEIVGIVYSNIEREYKKFNTFLELEEKLSI